MKKEQFDNTYFKKDQVVIYSRKKHLLKAVDFIRRDFGIVLPNKADDIELGLKWVSFAHCDIIDDIDESIKELELKDKLKEIGKKY